MQVLAQLKRLSDERFLVIYTALERDGFGPMDAEVARTLKFRPQAIRKLPMAQRAKRARAILERSANRELAYELFGSYLLTKTKGLVTDFLDATGVPHKDGMIDDIDGTKPAAEKISSAIARLDEKYDPADVTLYLSMCAEQWPQVLEMDSLWRLRG
jgi:hypothetical protein